MPELRSQADLEEALRTVERDKHGVGEAFAVEAS
jgi:hypothetical protein